MNQIHKANSVRDKWKELIEEVKLFIIMSLGSLARRAVREVDIFPNVSLRNSDRPCQEKTLVLFI